MAKAKRILFLLQCGNCKNRNYTSIKNPDNARLKSKGQAAAEKLLLHKYCKHCQKATEHKEIKI